MVFYQKLKKILAPLVWLGVIATSITVFNAKDFGAWGFTIGLGSILVCTAYVAVENTLKRHTYDFTGVPTRLAFLYPSLLTEQEVQELLTRPLLRKDLYGIRGAAEQEKIIRRWIHSAKILKADQGFIPDNYGAHITPQVIQARVIESLTLFRNNDVRVKYGTSQDDPNTFAQTMGADQVDFHAIPGAKVEEQSLPNGQKLIKITYPGGEWILLGVKTS